MLYIIIYIYIYIYYFVIGEKKGYAKSIETFETIETFEKITLENQHATKIIKNIGHKTVAQLKKIRTFAVRMSAALGIAQTRFGSALICTTFAKILLPLENLDACQKAGIGLPRFEQDENFKVTIPRRNVCQNNIDNQRDTKNVCQTKQAARYLKIMNTLLENRRTPQKEIAEMLGVSERTINRDLNVIRQSYSIKWIGSPNTGWWKK